MDPRLRGDDDTARGDDEPVRGDDDTWQVICTHQRCANVFIHRAFIFYRLRIST